MGDRFLAWKSTAADTKRHHAAWLTRWMDVETADAFFQAMTGALGHRYSVTVDAKGEVKFTAQGRHVCLKRQNNGQGVLLIDTGDEAALADLLSLLDGVTKP